MYPSLWQILIVLVIFVLLFGHKRIRELGKSLGEALRDFRKGLDDTADHPNHKPAQTSADAAKAVHNHKPAPLSTPGTKAKEAAESAKIKSKNN